MNVQDINTLKTGLLWFDDDPQKRLEEKVLEVAACYERKHGRRPNLCLVHPSAIDGHEPHVTGITIRPDRSVLLHHLWIGTGEGG